MGIFDKLFGRKKRCAKCGKPLLLEKVSLEQPGFDPFSGAIRNVFRYWLPQAQLVNGAVLLSAQGDGNIL